MGSKKASRGAVLALYLCGTIAVGSLNLPAAHAASKWDGYKKAGDAAYEAGDYAKAEQEFSDALKEAEKFEENDKRRATTIYNLALVLQTEQKFDEAEKYYKLSIDSLGKAFGAEHEKVAMAMTNLAEVYKMKEDLKQAEEYYLKGLEVYQKIYNDTNPELAAALDSVADFYAEQEEYAKAEPLYRHALDISKNAVGADKPETGKRLSHFAEFFCVQGKYAPAEPLFANALKIAEKTDGPDSADVGKICFNYGGLYYDQSQFPQAEKYFKRAIEISRKLNPDEVPMMQASLGDVLDMQGKHDEAEKVYKESLTALEKNADPNALIACLKNYQKHLNMSNKKEEAKQIGVRIKELKTKAAASGS